MHLDTHVVVWLYAGELKRFPAAARRRLDAEMLRVSPAVVMELQFLHEIGRISVPAATLVAALVADIGLEVCELPFHQIVAEACAFSWTRDPFDRLIVAHAMLRNSLLLTKDETILRHYAHATWG